MWSTVGVNGDGAFMPEAIKRPNLLTAAAG